MANAQRPIVNQRLYFCRLHLDWLSQELAREDLPQSVLEQSLGESLLFHLMMAYRAYLQEIAVAYSTPVHDVHNAQQLLTRLESNGYTSAEASELKGLEEAESWLAELFQRYRSVGSLQRAAAVIRPQSLAREQHCTEGTTGPLTNTECQGYFQALTAVIDNQRSRLEEW